MPQKTTEGKWLIWDRKGQQLERWPVDAKAMLATGEYTAEPPEGVEPKLPPAPPQHVGVPKAPVAQVFEGSAGAETDEQSPPAKSSKPSKAPKPPTAE